MRAAGLASAMIAITWALPCAAAARAAPPEFGHCVKNAKHEAGSGYANARCTEAVESGATHHWVPGPGAKPGFSASATGVDLYLVTKLSGVAKPSIECASASVVGEFTSADTESAGLTLSGCKMASASCESEEAAPGEVVFSPLEGLLVMRVREFDGEALIRWTPAIGETLASFECGTTSVVISGGILHEIRRDQMVSGERERFRVWSEGLQRPSCYEGSPCELGGVSLPVTSIGGAPGKASGLSMLGTQTNEEAIEADTLLP